MPRGGGTCFKHAIKVVDRKQVRYAENRIDGFDMHVRILVTE